MKSESFTSEKTLAQGRDLKVMEKLQISAGRKFIFRITGAVIIPVLALVLLEITLRVVGYGYPASAFVKCQVNGRLAYCSNNKFGWSFFPPEFSREFTPYIVYPDKADDTYRIFILGSSAAQGYPDSAYRFGRILRVMLRQQYPSVNFEVFTAAMPAINSHAIVRIARDCARLKPDLFVVYTGNNEVVGPYGAGTIFTPLSESLFLIRTGIAVKATRTGQLLNNLAGMTAPNKGGPKNWSEMAISPGKQIRHDDKKMQFVYDHFRQNLEDIARISQNAGVKIIFSTVGANLKDCPPFASMHQTDLSEQQKESFDVLFQNGIVYEKAGDFNEAIDKYLAAGGIDDSYAELQFNLGRCLWKLGRFDEARQRYANAMEFDAMRFRSDAKINQIIRQVSSNRTDVGIYLADAAGVFEQQSPYNCPGYELFLEHVHLNFSGNYLLAKTVYQQVEEILPDKIKTKKAEEGLPPSEEQCAKLLAFTDYDNLRIMQKVYSSICENPIFVNQARDDDIKNIWRQRIERMSNRIGPETLAKALEYYEQAIKLNSTDRLLRLNYVRLLLSGTNDIFGAAQQLRVIVELVPNDYGSLILLANLERTLGNINSSLKYAIMAVEMMPTEPTVNYTVGLGYQKRNQPGKAQKYFAENIRIDPTFIPAYDCLGQVLSQQGKNEQAEQIYQKGIEREPNNVQLHLGLAISLRKDGRDEEAKSELQKAILLDPNLARRTLSAPAPADAVK